MRVLQGNKHRDFGDCFRTCIASLLNLSSPDDVPPFIEMQEMRNWLVSSHKIGIAYFIYPSSVPLTIVKEIMRDTNPHQYYLIGGGTKQGVNHICVYLDDECVCNPAIVGNDIVQPMDTGGWLVAVLTHGITLA